LASPISFPRSVLALHCPIAHFDKLKQYKHTIFPALLPSDQPDRVLLQWLETCKKKHPELINTGDCVERVIDKEGTQIYCTGLPPLSIALICDRDVVAVQLAEWRGIDLNAKDQKGWTPLHHAIARKKRAVLDLIEKVDRTAANKFPFLRSIVEAAIPPNDKVVVSYLESDGTIREMSQKAFRKMHGGTPFFAGVRATPDALFHNWYKQRAVPLALNRWLEQRYENYLKNESPLLLSSEERAGSGVVAGRKIRYSEMICLVGGSLQEPVEEASKISSLSWSDLMNDGLPNVCEARLLIDGVETKALLAMRDIAKGERLLVDYNFSHQIKWLPRVEFASREIKNLFPNGKAVVKQWEAIERRLSNSVTPDELFEEGAFQSALRYLVDTPSIFLSLIVSKKVDALQMQKLFQDSTFRQFFHLNQEEGIAVAAFYERAFSFFQKWPSACDLPEVREYLATHLETHLRSAYIAARITIEKFKSIDAWKESFERIMRGVEDFFSAAEEMEAKRGAMGSFASLSEEERELIIQFAQSDIGFIFGDPSKLKEATADSS
jgi:hypothetical protein